MYTTFILQYLFMLPSLCVFYMNIPSILNGLQKILLQGITMNQVSQNQISKKKYEKKKMLVNKADLIPLNLWAIC